MNRTGIVWGRGSGGFHVYDEVEEAEKALGYGPRLSLLRGEGVGVGGWGPRGCGGRRLALAVVETVDIALVAGWASGEARATIRVLLSWDEFCERVVDPGELRKGLDVDGRRDLRVSAHRLREMRRLGYVRRMRTAPGWGANSPVFFVPKSGEEDRMIVDARALNRRCRRPPPAGFPDLHTMLRVLTGPAVRCYLSYDFSTWFVQLGASPVVRNVFAVRGRDSSWYRVTGIPMGWSWAPAVAQRVAESIAHESLRRLEMAGIGCFVYVDNIIFYVEGDRRDVDARAAVVDATFRAACKEAGAVIKESAVVVGQEVDWLGVRLRAGSRECRFRDKFVEKVGAVASVLREEGDQAVRYWWRATALALRALWVAREPLARIRDPLRFLVRTAARLARGEIGWERVVSLWSEARKQLLEVYAWIGGEFLVRCAADRVLARGVSDAAGGSHGYGGYVVRKGREVLAVRMRLDGGAHINVREHEALEAGVMAALRMTKGSGRILWGGDNTCANAWGRATWSPDWGLCERMRRRHVAMAARAAELEVVKIPGGDENPADLLTRSVSGSPWLRDDATWQWRFDAGCGCAGVCAHVVRIMKKALRVRTLSPSTPARVTAGRTTS